MTTRAELNGRPIRGGDRVFIIRQEFGWDDHGGRWHIRERRVFGIAESGAVEYVEGLALRYGDNLRTANPSHVFRSRAEAHRVALLLNAAPTPQ